MRTAAVVVVVMVGLVAGACAASDDDGECGGWWRVAPSSSDAWRGVVVACQRAPGCPVARSCDDPRWSVLADWALDEIAACFVGPCEERETCLAAALPPSVCWANAMAIIAGGGDGGGDDRSTTLAPGPECRSSNQGEAR